MSLTKKKKGGVQTAPARASTATGTPHLHHHMVPRLL